MGLGSLIAAIGVVWWVVSTLIAASTKKQEQQRLEELARKRREQARQVAGQGAIGPDATQASTGPPVAQSAARAGAPPVSPRAARIDELRRRRDAQLEELRRRRQKPAPQQQPVSRSMGQGRSARTNRPAQARSGQAKPQQQPRPTGKGTAQQSQPRRPAPLADHHLKTKIDSHVGEGLRARHITAEPDQPARQTAGARVSSSPRTVRESLGGRMALRRAFILKEILDAPIALR